MHTKLIVYRDFLCKEDFNSLKRAELMTRQSKLRVNLSKVTHIAAFSTSNCSTICRVKS